MMSKTRFGRHDRPPASPLASGSAWAAGKEKNQHWPLRLCCFRGQKPWHLAP